MFRKVQVFKFHKRESVKALMICGGNLDLADLRVTSVCVSDSTWEPDDLKVELSVT